MECIWFRLFNGLGWKQLVEGNEFQLENEVPGLDHVIEYLPEEKILLLGPPLIINEDNVNDFDF